MLSHLLVLLLFLTSSLFAQPVPNPVVWQLDFNSTNCNASTLVFVKPLGFQDQCTNAGMWGPGYTWHCVNDTFISLESSPLGCDHPSNGIGTTYGTRAGVCYESMQGSYIYTSAGCSASSFNASTSNVKFPPLIWGLGFKGTDSCDPKLTQEYAFYMGAIEGQCFSLVKVSQRFYCDRMSRYDKIYDNCPPSNVTGRTISSYYPRQCIPLTQRIRAIESTQWFRIGCNDTDDTESTSMWGQILTFLLIACFLLW